MVDDDGAPAPPSVHEWELRVHQLRSLVAACSRREQHGAAAWYANKLVTLTQTRAVLAPLDAGAAHAYYSDVYALALAYHRAGQHLRAFRTLDTHGLIDTARHAVPLPQRAGAVDAALRGPRGAPAYAAPPSAGGGPLPASVIQPMFLPAVYLAAQCLKAVGSTERVVGLLEAAMEGHGMPLLRVPLAETLDAVATADGEPCAAASGGGGGAGGGGSPARMPLSAAAGSGATAGSSGAASLGLAATTVAMAAAGGGGSSGAEVTAAVPFSALDRAAGTGSGVAAAGTRGAAGGAAEDASMERAGAAGGALARGATSAVDDSSMLPPALHRTGTSGLGSGPAAQRRMAALQVGDGGASAAGSGAHAVVAGRSAGGATSGAAAAVHPVPLPTALPAFAPTQTDGVMTWRLLQAMARRCVFDRVTGRPSVAELPASGVAAVASLRSNQHARVSQAPSMVVEALAGHGGTPPSAAGRVEPHDGFVAPLADADAPGGSDDDDAPAGAALAAAHVIDAATARASRPAHLDAGSLAPSDGSDLNLVACMCLLRAEGLLALNNRVRAREWLLAALRLDVYCVPALQLLVDHHLLDEGEEARLAGLLSETCGIPAFIFLGTTTAFAPATPVAGLPAAAGGVAQSVAEVSHGDGSAPLAAAARAPRPGSALASPPVASNSTKPAGVFSRAAAAASLARSTSDSSSAPVRRAQSSADVLSPPSAASAPSTGATTTVGGVRSGGGALGLRSAASARSLTRSGSAAAATPVTPATAAGSRSGPAHAKQPLLSTPAAAASPVSSSRAATGSRGTTHSLATGPAATNWYAQANLAWLQDLHCMRLQRYAITANIASKFSDLERRFGLGPNYDVLAAKAEALAYQHDEAASHALTRRLMSYDPHDARVAALHYTNLTVLRRSAELFQLAHASVKAAPRDPLSWYAVGCYYLTLDRPAVASRHFTKATQLDPAHALSWIGLGQCFALLQEHEPAMHAYRAACLLLPKAHVPQLAMAAVAARNGQITLAKQYLDAATALCMSDPLVYHEAGVLEYKQGAYGTAWGLFNYALNLVTGCPLTTRRVWEPTMVAMGHACRKLGRFADAIRWYEEALSLSPGKHSTIAALAYANHLAGNFDKAIGLYHSALSRDPDDHFSHRMLGVALHDVLVLLPAGSWLDAMTSDDARAVRAVEGGVPTAAAASPAPVALARPQPSSSSSSGVLSSPARARRPMSMLDSEAEAGGGSARAMARRRDFDSKRPDTPPRDHTAGLVGGGGATTPSPMDSGDDGSDSGTGADAAHTHGASASSAMGGGVGVGGYEDDDELMLHGGDASVLDPATYGMGMGMGGGGGVGGTGAGDASAMFTSMMAGISGIDLPPGIGLDGSSRADAGADADDGLLGDMGGLEDSGEAMMEEEEEEGDG